MAYVSRVRGKVLGAGNRLTANFDQYIFQAPSGLPKSKSLGGSAFGAGQKVTVGLKPGTQGQTSFDVINRPGQMPTDFVKQISTTVNVTSGMSITHSPQTVLKTIKPVKSQYSVQIIRPGK